ncbi:MAG TPA: serine protease [Vicinamibacterales bacterium]|nr:serine protease [Vicinamibacterales bacterium]
MTTRRTLPAVFAFAFAVVLFGVGNYLGARQNADNEARFAALRAELNELRHRTPVMPTGTSGRIPDPASSAEVDAIVDDVKRQLSDEMGLFPLDLLRDRRASFVELYSYDDRGASSYGTAGYLGNGYFITVKHGVVALGQDGLQDPRRITSVKLAYGGKLLTARVVDVGDAKVEVDPGDWAIVKVKEKIDLPALNPNLAFGFEFADPIFRLGNDYSKGIIVSTGYVGQKTPNSLVTCLTDGHPGVSGGGVLNRDGELVGIPVGRMQGDYRFSFILPLRQEMFRKVSF